MNDNLSVDVRDRNSGGCNGIIILRGVNKQGEAYSLAEIGTFLSASVDLSRTNEDLILISWKIHGIVVNKKLFDEFTAAKAAGDRAPALTIEFELLNSELSEVVKIQLLTCKVESFDEALRLDSTVLFAGWKGSAREYITLPNN